MLIQTSKSARQEAEEVDLLREQVRDLSEMNLALRRELAACRGRLGSVGSATQSFAWLWKGWRPFEGSQLPLLSGSNCP